jgi:hypothetical protein
MAGESIEICGDDRGQAPVRAVSPREGAVGGLFFDQRTARPVHHLLPGACSCDVIRQHSPTSLVRGFSHSETEDGGSCAYSVAIRNGSPLKEVKTL